MSNRISADARCRRRRLGHRRVGRDQAVHQDGVAVLLAVGLEQLARLVGLAEPAQPVGDGQRGAQAIAVERDAARRYFDSAAALSPAISSIWASITSAGASERSPAAGLSLARKARAAAKSFSPALSHAITIVAQHAELVLGADAAELLLGGLVFALLDRLDCQHEVGEAVARPRRQHLRRELGGGIDTAGVHAHAEGGIDQLGIGRRQRQRRVHLIGRRVVVVILLGHARGEIAAVERGRDLAAPLGLGLRLRRRLGLGRPALLGIDGRRKRKQQRGRQQREECASHTCHMLG